MVKILVECIKWVLVYLQDNINLYFLEHDVSCNSALHKTPVTPEWRPYSVPTAFKKIAERRGARCANASNAVETLWKRCGIA